MAKISLNLESIKTYEKTERLKLKDGQTIFRILPPFGDVEVHNNYPYRRWSVAWLNDPRSGKRRPYGSPMSGGKDAPCPVNEFNKALSAYVERTKSKLIHEGLSDAEIKEDLSLLNKAAWEVKVNHVYAYNVATKDGKISVMEVKTTVHKGLKKLMGDYIKTYGQDPTALTSNEEDNAGVWMAVERSGMNRDTEYSVDFNQIKTRSASGKITKEDDRSPLSPHIEENYATSGYDLSTLYKTLSYDEIKVVLMSNLAVLAESEPRLGQIPGFLLNEGVEEQVETTASNKNTKPTSPAPKTLIALDDEDLDDEEPPFEVTPVALPPKAKAVSSARQLADSLLDD